jgi:hypothetical protein
MPPDQARLPRDGEVLTVGIQQLEAEQAHRHVPHHLGDAVLAPPEHDLAERAQLPGGRVDGDDLPLDDRLGRAQPRRENLDDIGEQTVGSSSAGIRASRAVRRSISASRPPACSRSR